MMLSRASPGGRDHVWLCCCAQFVFGTCAAGAVVLTVNVVLLGGNIGFFQSMCLLGYCLFPMDCAAIVTACTTNMIARWIVVLVRGSLRPPPTACFQGGY